jgi:hypothetical protein
MGNRKYVSHGEKRMKRKDYTLAACAAACSTLYLQGGGAEMHYISTASTGCGVGANVNLDLAVPSGHAGAFWIVYDSNNACDSTDVDILVNGTAIADTSQTIGANDERLIIVNVVSTNPLLVAAIAADNLD